MKENMTYSIGKAAELIANSTELSQAAQQNIKTRLLEADAAYALLEFIGTNVQGLQYCDGRLEFADGIVKPRSAGGAIKWSHPMGVFFVDNWSIANVKYDVLSGDFSVTHPNSGANVVEYLTWCLLNPDPLQRILGFPDSLCRYALCK